MAFLLDTVLVSEPTKRPRNLRVMAWYQSADPGDLFISALTIGEIRLGASLLKKRNPQAALIYGAWIDGLREQFAGRILPIDDRVADRWGELRANRTLPILDGLIAATALVRGLTLVTRNVRDFSGIGLKILNPWSAAE